MKTVDRCMAAGLLLPAAILCTVPAVARGQEAGGADAALVSSVGVPPAPKRTHAVRVETGSVGLDGRLDETVWATAGFRSDFQQKSRDRGFDPWAGTEVAFLYDAEALYVGARMERDSRGGVGPILGQRDDAGNSDRIIVALDTQRDRTTAHAFGVTSAGVRLDYAQARDAEDRIDASFDPVWEVEVASDSAGWTAEMRIPFSQLRFSPAAEQVWGLNVRRSNPTTFLNTYWVVIPYDEVGWVSRFGELRGLVGVSGGAGAEIVPYVVQQATYLDRYYGGDGRADPATRVGGDMKLGLGSNLTLDATVNPDFGQVEADPARVNLTAFETSFPERRPFFLESRDLFDAPGPTWFYSRRIGSAPPRAVGLEPFEQVENTRILGGLRLTGRSSSGFSTVGLAALTDRATLDADGGGSFEAAPRTAFGVVRVRQEVGTSGSSVGVLGTAVERFFSGGDAADLLPGRSLSAGGDFVLRFGGGAYEIAGFGGASLISGTQEAMDLRMRSSAHYFQRPDADHVSLASRTRLGGWTAGVEAGRIAGLGWLWSAEASATSPGFEIRDMGLQDRGDLVRTRIGLSHVTRERPGAIRGRSLGLSFAGEWNFGGVRTMTAPSAFISTTWRNLWTSYLEVGTSLPALSDDLTRGGPLMATPMSWWTRLRLSALQTGATWWSLEGYGSTDANGGWSTSLDGGYTVQAGRYLGLSLHAGGLLADDARQYLQSFSGGPESTFGRRYVFSSIKRSELFAQVRAEIAFAPDAVLTVYAEPFVSSGRTHAFGELGAARSRVLRTYGSDGTTIERLEDGTHQVVDGDDTFLIQNFDFWVRSFRSSAVLSWEWRAGSFLYLIWRREQWRWNPFDGPTGPESLIRSFDEPGMDILLAKASVLLGRR